MKEFNIMKRQIIRYIKTPTDSSIITSIFEDLSSQHPEELVLYQAYPNPFNPATTISYRLPETIHVELGVYDVLGREVVRLVDKQQAAGHYQINWNTLNSKNGPAASGTCFVRLKTEKNVRMIKVFLLK